MVGRMTHRWVTYAAVCCAVALLVRGLMKRANRADHQSPDDPYAQPVPMTWVGFDGASGNDHTYRVSFDTRSCRYTVGPTGVPSSLN